MVFISKFKVILKQFSFHFYFKPLHFVFLSMLFNVYEIELTNTLYKNKQIDIKHL